MKIDNQITLHKNNKMNKKIKSKITTRFLCGFFQLLKTVKKNLKNDFFDMSTKYYIKFVLRNDATLNDRSIISG